MPISNLNIIFTYKILAKLIIITFIKSLESWSSENISPNAMEHGAVEANFQNGTKDVQGNTGASEQQVALKVTRSVTTLFSHVLIGLVVGTSVIFSFRNGLPLNATNLHIVLCVIGYQLLMAEAILALAPDSWVSSLKLRHKKFIHLIMQVVGSLLAIIGSFIKIVDKSVHWNTLHGQFALVALVFTTVSLVNGLTSLYAYELRRIMPAFLSKLTHICFGIVSLVAASISLCYGFDKSFFRNWATSASTDALIILTLVLTVIVIINPFITFYKRLLGVVGK